MILMIEHTIESSHSLPFIGCKSGLSKWLEDLSKATNLFKAVHNLENAISLLEDPQIYELIYPSQSLMSDRLFEEISRRNEDSEPEKLLSRDQDDRTKAHGSSEVTTINMLLSKEKHKADFGTSGLHRENRKKSTGNGLKDEIPQAELDVKLSTDLTEVENKFPVKSDVRKKLLRNIINMHGRKIEDNQLGKDLNALKRVLQSPAVTSFERLKSDEKIRAFHKRAEYTNLSESERNFFSIEEEHSLSRYYKDFLSEKLSEQFSRHIEGISTSRDFLEKKSGEIRESNLIESNQRSEASFAGHLIHDLKSLSSEKQLIENKEFNVSSGRISEQFSRHIEGISVSKESLEEMSGKMTSSNLVSLNKSSLAESNQYSKTRSNQHSKTNFSNSDMQDFKSLKPEEQLVENDKFKINPDRISKQFSRHIEGISVSKRSLEEKLRGNSCQNSYFSAGNNSYNLSDLKSKSNHRSERIRYPFDKNQFDKNQFDKNQFDKNQFDRNQFDRNQFDRNQFDRNQFDRNQFDKNQFDKISDSDLKISENNKQSDLLSLTSVNLLIEKAYSNSTKKSDIKEENRELLLNLIENLNQVMNQTNRDTTPTRQNVFNIQVSGEGRTGESDLKNLSDRLVLILKDQARRHGIDLS